MLAIAFAAPALAGLGGSVVPSFPTPLNVGDVRTATITITNRATNPNLTEELSVSGIFFTPSCAASDGFSCSVPDVNVFQFGTVVGRNGSSCASIPFTLGPANPATGEFELIPPSNRVVELGPADGSGPLPKQCVISINFMVLRTPQDSTPGDPAPTTISLARATLQGQNSGNQGMATGGGTTIISVPQGQGNLVATPGDERVALAWAPPSGFANVSIKSLAAAAAGTTYKLVFALGSPPASCNAGTTLMTGTKTNFTHSNLANGVTYFYRLCTIDAQGNMSAGETASAVPQPQNNLPVANAGPNVTTPTLAPVAFNGSGSSDSDGSIVSYTWTFGDGSSASGMNVSHAYATAGTYTVTLTVTDNAGGTDNDTTTVTVTNRPPVANAGSTQFTQTLTSNSFNGSASSDPDGSIVSYNWSFGDGTSGSGMIVSHAYATPGVYTATLTVTDNNGATATASATINVANRPPVAVAGPDKSSPAQTPVSFSGSGSSDPDGTITSYAWNFGDGSSGTGLNTSHAYQSNGIYTVTLTVTDNSGATATDTAVVNITSSGGQSTGAFISAARYGGTGPSGSYATAVDSSGNLYIAGAFAGTVSFGGASLAAAGSTDVFVAKYSASGAHLWSKRFGGTLDDSAQSVAVDSNGNVFVSGYFKTTIDFGAGPMTAYYSGFGGQMRDAFIVKLSPTGAHLWSRKMGSFGHDIAYGIAVDGGGNLVVAGTFVGPVDFGGTSLSSNSDSADIFLAKYAPAGALLWVKKFGNNATDNGYGVAVETNGNIALVGAFTGSVDFGGGALVSAGSSDIVAAKYSPTGAYLWAKRFGDDAQDVGFAVAMDSVGNVFVTGYFQGLVDFGGGIKESLGAIDTFVAKYSATGAHVWSHGFGGTNADEGFGITADANGNAVIVGTFQGSANFGNGTLTAAGSWDVVVAKYSPSGTPLWSKQFGGPLDDLGYSIVTDASGKVTLSGTFQGTVDFGGGPMTSSAYNDVFVLKLAP